MLYGRAPKGHTTSSTVSLPVTASVLTASPSPSIFTTPVIVTTVGNTYTITIISITLKNGASVAPSSLWPKMTFSTTVYGTLAGSPFPLDTIIVTTPSPITEALPLVTTPTVTTPTTTAPTTTTPKTTSVVSTSTTPTTISSTSSSSVTSSSTTSGGSSASSSGPIQSNGGGGVGGGVVAGIAIGCVLGGVLIGALLIFFLMRRRNARNNRNRSNRSNGFAEKRSSPTTAPLLGAGVGAGAGAGAVAATAWQNHLPQSESDNTMRNAVQAMLTQVELHVDNYYRDTVVPLTSELESELMRLKLDSHLPDTLIGLLPQTRSPTILIQHCLAQLVVSRVAIDEAGENNISDSFLPADFTALAGATGSSRNVSSRPAYAPALSQHRRLTSYLRPPPSSDRAYLSARDARISRAADTFTAAFSPWARPTQSPDARRAHLISVLKAAAETGILIFSQPSSFRWVWDMPRSGGGGGGGLKVVVLPGFVKVADETARVLDRPQLLTEPTVNSLT